MRPKLFLSTLLVSVLTCSAAIAANNNDSTANTAQTPSYQSQQSLPQEIKQKLTKQGFSNIKVVPGSFLVSAKDEDGDPVTMVIGPHSMSVFTAITSDHNSTTGSAVQNKDTKDSMSK